MRALKELVMIVTKNKVKSISIIGNPQGKKKQKNQLNVFYDKLTDGSFDSDEDAADFFYGTNPDNKSYKKLKSSFKNRLINTLFFIDLKESNYSEFEKAYYACCKDWAAAKILFRKSARESGMSICQKVFKLSLKYEFTELLVDTTRILRLHYGSRVGDIQKFKHYNELFKTFEKVWQLENLAEEYYTELIIEYVNNKSTKENIFLKAQEKFQELEEYMRVSESAKLHFVCRMIEVMAYMGINDYQETIKICETAVTFFLRKPFVYKTALTAFYHQQLVCYTQLKEFEKGAAVVANSLPYLTEGSFNWFKYQELYFILAMHTRHYKEAGESYKKIVEHKRFRFLPPSAKETWKVFEAYLFYLAESGELQEWSSPRTFKGGKFLNELPIFSKDKRGFNIPILIIQIMFFNLRKKYDLLIDRTEAIEKYCSRYLRKDDNFRSNCFIKMLLQIPVSQFHRAGVIRKAEKYKKQLESSPLDIANQSYEIEIIPYEQLWELVVAPLENTFHKTR